MSFVQKPINYAEQYAQELANAYPYLSYFGDLYNGEMAQRYKPVNGNGVWIPSIETSGAKAVNRDSITGAFSRNFNVSWELKTMSMYREWDTIVDPMSVVESNDVATIANVTRAFNELQKVPEMDAYAASKIAGFAGDFGGVDSTTLTSANILAQFDAYLAYMVNQRVSRDRIVCKITPTNYKLLKEAAGITRFVDAATGIRNIDRNVGKLDGVLIEEVPEDIMQSAFDFTEGWVKAAGASQIGLIMYAPESLCAPIVYDVSMLTAPSAATKGKTVYYESYYYDMFALNQRQGGIFAHVSAPSLGVLTVTSVAGDSAGDTIIAYKGAQINDIGNPNFGIDAYITYGNNAAPTVTYGAALPSATWVKVTGTNPVELAGETAGKYATVALVNKQTGYAIAAGSAVEVVGV